MPKHKYITRAATVADAEHLAPRLRQADIDEVEAATGSDPLEALLTSLRHSEEAFVWEVDGEVVCMFGVAGASLMSDRGSPWMLTSDVLVHHARVFLRGAREAIAYWKKDYSYLCNFVDARNTQAIRWLQWLGFDILPPRAFGPQDMMFHIFEMKGY